MLISRAQFTAVLKEAKYLGTIGKKASNRSAVSGVKKKAQEGRGGAAAAAAGASPAKKS